MNPVHTASNASIARAIIKQTLSTVPSENTISTKSGMLRNTKSFVKTEANKFA